MMLKKLYRFAAILVALSLVWGGFQPAMAAPVRESPPLFSFANRVLSISTNSLDIRFENGAITYVKDKASGEVLLNGSSTQNRPSVTKGFIGFSSKDAVGNYYLRWPTESSKVTFSLLQPNVGRLTYSSLYYNGSLATGSTLTYDITIDASGEILLQLTGTEGAAGYIPVSIDLPIMNAVTQSAILGSGAEYTRSEASKNDQTTYADYGIYAPSMVVLKGGQSVFSAWSETTRFAPEYVSLIHTPGYDHVVLHSETDYTSPNQQQLVSPIWRIGTYPAWYEAARRWRVMFETRTGAKPLWQNDTLWVRNVHAVFNGLYQYYDHQQQQYGKLAAILPPQETLYLLWNGDRIVLFGEHTLADGIGRPTTTEMANIKKYGWPVILYHPWDLIYTEQKTTNRLDQLRKTGYLPAGYQFNPDYVGTASGWQGYWADVKANYDAELYVIHPASDKFKTYFPVNFSNYLARHSANGAYLDTMGVSDLNRHFAANKRVINGTSFVMGERDILAQTRAQYPQLAMMSEYQSTWVLPYAFYTWEGTETHKNAGLRLNHPLRVALMGSYTWTREDNAEVGLNDNQAALLGTLPQVSLEGDYEVVASRVKWSQARARLFTENDLFNDIPPVWKDDVLAYYRSNSGNWFAYKKIGSVYGYVEILPNGSEVVRLTKDNIPPPTTTPIPTIPPSPTPIPTSIPSEPYGYVQAIPQGIEMGGTAKVEVGLGNVPAEGFAGVEFACTYDANVIEATNIAVTDLFGADPVVATNGPQNGALIVAVAGSQENKAITGGVVFNFDTKGLQAGQTFIECKTRIVKDDDTLISLLSNGARLIVSENAPHPTVEPTYTPQPFFPSPTLEPLPSPTPLPPTTGALTGRIQSSKSVTIELYTTDNTLALSQDTNADGTFGLNVHPGIYTVLIKSAGFLSMQGQITLVAGQSIELPIISLLAGDLDGNNVIDQFDALTIGMGYNTAFPEAADLNNDGVINLLDLRLLSRNYRQAGPLSW